MSLAIVFPGQGSQSVGMLSELAEKFPLVIDTFAEASEAIKLDLWQLVSEGPAEKLNSTRVTQPAMLAAGIATWRVWNNEGGETPKVMAGHSLGEYSALVAAGAVSFADAIRLVSLRGQFMQEAVPEGVGAMAAILGLDDEAVRNVCSQAADNDVAEAVNFNSPGQVVIAGDKAAIDRAIELAKEAGAKRALPLPVSVPSHCALMKPAAERLAEVMVDIEFNSPAIPVLHNCDVSVHDNADEIRVALKAQLFSPVRWVETIQAMQNRGVDKMIECGPGKVLTGLNKRIDKSLATQAVFDHDSLSAALAQGEQ
jgi:[acyl-carrier-protein] S-malonyltransferase